MRSSTLEGTFSNLMKKLDTTGGPTWRFWSRVALETLPTHGQMATYAAASEENAYKSVYRDTLGEHGRCTRCGAAVETTRHALYQCPDSGPRWEKLDYELEQLWETYGLRWNEWNWIQDNAKKYPGWKIEHAIAGLVPKQLGQETGINTSLIGIKKLISETSQLIIKASYKVWERRNDEVKKWIETIPELKQRKEEANRNGWRVPTKAGVRPKRERPEGLDPEHIKNRLQRLRRTVEITKQEEARRFRAIAEEETTKHEDRCRRTGEIRAHPDETRARERASVKKQQRTLDAWARGVVKKAKLAEGTRDLEESEMGEGSMETSQPATSTARRDYHWIPKVGTDVDALWTSATGVKVGNLRGQWWSGKVTALEWPEGEGIPGVWIKYAAGHTEWHSVDMCGTTIRRKIKDKRNPKNDKKGRIDPDTTFDKKVCEWLGIGSRIRVKWIGEGKWWRGKVMGTDRHGVIVRYADGSTVAHNDLHTRGTKVEEFRRAQDQREYYKQREWLQCPYGGEEGDCECLPCERDKWPKIGEAIGLTDDEIAELVGTKPWERMKQIEAWGKTQEYK
jgi:hypothetical protein